ncbi:hypothetical protein [Shimia biformata]|uniref:hypothetical protein n=1 Tax=Shimia biformata TaxID=1294299 RepID=UPI00194E4020|nr:hypothetical protein [Shimia biformata]
MKSHPPQNPPQNQQDPDRLIVQSTRLFPKGQGADAYRIEGIAARCDWVFLSDWIQPQTHLVRNTGTDTPRHIFLSLRAPQIALRRFAEDILPRLSQDFILVSGSEDATLPQQIDHRWPRGDGQFADDVRAILDSPYLRHWFVENLDTDGIARMSPLPIGLVFPEGYPETGIAVPPTTPLGQRPLRVLCAHHHREGPQWEPRRHVSGLAKHAWSDWCTVLDAPIPLPDYLRLIDGHAFVLCVEGGGLDPAPKAWHALLHGAIPIMRRNPTSDGYADLPVVHVPDWTEDSLSLEKLQLWQAQYAPRQDDPDKRRALLEQLGLDYWWEKIRQKAPIR